MQKKCWYCDRPLRLPKRLKGDLFCSEKHEELYHASQSELALKRVIGFERKEADQAARQEPEAKPEPTPPVQRTVERAAPSVPVSATPAVSSPPPILSRPIPEPRVAPPPSAPKPTPETSEMPPLGAILRQFYAEPIPPEAPAPLGEEALDLTPEPTYPGSASTREPSLSLDAPSLRPEIRPRRPALKVVDTDTIAPPLDAVYKVALPTGALELGTILHDTEAPTDPGDTPPFAGWLPEWGEGQEMLGEMTSLPRCEPVRPEPASPRPLPGFDIEPPSIVAKGFFSSWVLPGAADDSRIAFSATVAPTLQLALQLGSVPANAPSPQSSGLLYASFGEHLGLARGPEELADVAVPEQTRRGEVRLAHFTEAGRPPSLQEDQSFRWEGSNFATRSDEFGNVPNLAELPRRNLAPVYSGTQTATQVAIRDWALPVATLPRWEPRPAESWNAPVEMRPVAWGIRTATFKPERMYLPAKIFFPVATSPILTGFRMHGHTNSWTSVTGSLPARTARTWLLPAAGRRVELQLGSASWLGRPSDLRESASAAFVAAPANLRSSPIKLPAKAAPITRLARLRRAGAPEPSLAQYRSTQAATPRAQQYRVHPTPMSLLSKPQPGGFGRVTSPPHARDFTFSFTHMVSGRPLYVNPLPVLHRAQGPALGGAVGLVPAELPLQPAEHVLRIEAASVGNSAVVPHPSLDATRPPAIGVSSTAHCRSRLIPTGRAAEFFPLPQTSGEAPALPLWITPARVRPASLLWLPPLPKSLGKVGVRNQPESWAAEHARFRTGSFNRTVEQVAVRWYPVTPRAVPLVQPVHVEPRTLARTRPRAQPLNLTARQDSGTVPAPPKVSILGTINILKPITALPPLQDPCLQRPDPLTLFRAREDTSPSLFSVAGSLPRRRRPNLPSIQDLTEQLGGQSGARL